MPHRAPLVVLLAEVRSVMFGSPVVGSVVGRWSPSVVAMLVAPSVALATLPVSLVGRVAPVGSVHDAVVVAVPLTPAVSRVSSP